MVKTHTTLDYSKDFIFKILHDKESRAKWDTVFPNVELVESLPQTNQQILYMILKSKMPFSSDREMVLLKTVVQNMPNHKSVLIHIRSTEHEKYPINKKYVRAQMITSGYFIEEIEPNKCKMAVVRQMDFDLASFIMNKIAPKALINWVNNLKTGCAQLKEAK